MYQFHIDQNETRILYEKIKNYIPISVMSSFFSFTSESTTCIELKFYKSKQFKLFSGLQYVS